MRADAGYLSIPVPGGRTSECSSFVRYDRQVTDLRFRYHPWIRCISDARIRELSVDSSCLPLHLLCGLDKAGDSVTHPRRYVVVFPIQLDIHLAWRDNAPVSESCFQQRPHAREGRGRVVITPAFDVCTRIEDEQRISGLERRSSREVSGSYSPLRRGGRLLLGR